MMLLLVLHPYGVVSVGHGLASTKTEKTLSAEAATE